MLSLSEINREIQRIEATEETTYSNVQKLAWLYIVRDKMEPKSEAQRQKQSYNAENANSDFLILISTKDINGVISVVNELVETIRTLHPRMYDAFMKRLYDL